MRDRAHRSRLDATARVRGGVRGDRSSRRRGGRCRGGATRRRRPRRHPGRPARQRGLPATGGRRDGGPRVDGGGRRGPRDGGWAMTEQSITLTVNGATRSGTVEPRLTLADFLRERCRLTGTHLGCEHGVCGACTVLVDGAAVRSCLMFAVQADGAEVTTVEGLSGPDGELSDVQAAFRD